MSAIQAPALILVTGGTGFLGAAVISNLLESGFHIRAAIRSESKISLLKAKFEPDIDSGKLTFVVVPDMTAPNAFVEAVKGVDGIIHSASPLGSTDPKTDPEVIIRPAVDITLRILEDAATNSGVKRVVLTSSIVTVVEPHESGYRYTENDWFDTAPKIVMQNGVNTPPFVKYMASKVLAERAAWTWVKEHNPTFEFVTVLPSWIWGKDLLENPDSIRPESSNYFLLNGISRAKSGELMESEYLSQSGFVNLVDAAEGHVKALTTASAAGERIILNGGNITWQDIFDIINANATSGITAPVGSPGSGKTHSLERYFVAEKSEKILGMRYKSLEDTIQDTIESALNFGWKP